MENRDNRVNSYWSNLNIVLGVGNKYPPGGHRAQGRSGERRAGGVGRMAGRGEAVGGCKVACVCWCRVPAGCRCGCAARRALGSAVELVLGELPDQPPRTRPRLPNFGCISTR